MNRGLLGLFLFAALAPIVGCAPSLESKLVGRWKLDTSNLDIAKAMQAGSNAKAAEAGAEAAAGADAVAGADAAAGGAEAGFLQGMAGLFQSMIKIDVEMEFRDDHTMQFSSKGTAMGQNIDYSNKGTWKVESVGENQMTISTTDDKGKTDTRVITFVDDNTLTAKGNFPGVGDQQVKLTRIVPAA